MEVWENGIAVNTFGGYLPLGVKNVSKCVMKYGGKIIYVDPICGKDDKECFERQMAFLLEIPDWNEESDLEENEAYTWILFKTDAGELNIAMTKAYSMFELGTVHNAIALRNGAVSVHGAGELKKSGSKVSYNLLSGTYMLKWSKDPRYPEIMKIIDEKIKTFLPNAVYDPDPNTYITRQEVTPQEYALFQKAKFIVTLFDSEDQCRAALNIDEYGRPFKKKKGGVSPMEGIIRPIAIRPGASKSQAQMAREQLASQGIMSTRPSSRESGLSALGQRPKSPSLGFGRRRRKTLRKKKNRKSTRRHI